MAVPTIIADYVGHTYNYTHPKSGRLITLHITPDMVGKTLDVVLDEADRKQSRYRASLKPMKVSVDFVGAFAVLRDTLKKDGKEAV